MLTALLLAAAPAAEFDLYLLAGQSNMEGYGTVAELPEDLRGPVEGAWIYQGNLAEDGQPPAKPSAWTPLKPGHGTGYWNAGGTENLSQRFGPELTFARRMRELRPGRRVAVVKYAKGGSSVAEEVAGRFGSWDPDYRGGEGEGRGVNQYDQCLAAVAAATAVRDIDGDGEADTLVPRGIVWMQGETDSMTEPTATAYAENLHELVELLRASLRKDDLPVVIGRISDSGRDEDGVVWTFGDILREEQRTFVNRDPAARIVVSTDEYGYSDPWHYDTAGYVDLGRRFAEGMDSLLPAE